MMSTIREGNQKKKVAAEPKAASWKEKKSLAEEEEVLQKEIEDLRIWAEMMDSMNDEQKKEYLHNRPNELKTVKIQKGKPRQRVQRGEKSRPSTSNGILASVWKFHKEDDEELKSGSDV